jgi:hypothetical protein
MINIRENILIGEIKAGNNNSLIKEELILISKKKPINIKIDDLKNIKYFKDLQLILDVDSINMDVEGEGIKDNNFNITLKRLIKLKLKYVKKYYLFFFYYFFNFEYKTNDKIYYERKFKCL